MKMRIVKNGFSLTAEEYSICLKAMEILERIANKADTHILWYDSATSAGSINDLFSDFYKGEDKNENHSR
jgi:hypothetical protein